MKEKWRIEIVRDCESEGFDYAFNYYDDYSWVIDEEFQKLKETYYMARKQLMDYVGLDD